MPDENKNPIDAVGTKGQQNADDGFSFITEFIGKVTPEKRAKLFEHQQFIDLISPHVDKCVTSGVKTNQAKLEKHYLEEIVPKKVEEQYRLAHPEDSQAARDAALANQKIDALIRENKIKDLINKGNSFAISKNFPELSDIVSSWCADDRSEEKLLNFIDSVEQAFSSKLKKAEEEFRKSAAPNLKAGGENGKFTFSTIEEAIRIRDRDPQAAESPEFFKRWSEICEGKK